MDRNRIIKALSRATIKATGAKTAFSVGKELGRGGNGATFAVTSAKQELVAKFYIPPDSRDLNQSAFKRFQREMQLAGQVRHPYVVRAEGIGTAQVGAYNIPFYLMKLASGTLRDLVPTSFALTGLADRLRAFTRAMQGVSYLHHLGIVHRDLKPENILLFGSTPKIADLGIAHVAPGFANVSQLTVPKEQLMNRDYYAPEQRHGDATKVDHRADIYALGCILYEIITGISPTRPNLPSLEEFHKSMAPLDKIINKMTAHSLSGRYQDIDSVIDEFSWALLHVGIPTAAPSTEEDDKKDLLRLLKSTNGVNQAKAIEPAMRLGAEALPLLHEQIGNSRLDVAIAAYRILGEIGSETSVPKVRVTKSDFVRQGQHSPIRDKNPNGTEISVSELLRFAISESDGTASDVLMKLAGGPGAVQAYLTDFKITDMIVLNSEKEIGQDWQTQYRNWASPEAAAALLRALHERQGLSESSQALLLKYMIESTPGAKRLKGQLPADTVVAHKTGTSGTQNGVTAATNDIGIITLPNGKHLAIAVFVSDSPGDEATREGVIAKIAKVVWDAYGK